MTMLSQGRGRGRALVQVPGSSEWDSLKKREDKAERLCGILILTP